MAALMFRKCVKRLALYSSRSQNIVRYFGEGKAFSTFSKQTVWKTVLVSGAGLGLASVLTAKYKTVIAQSVASRPRHTPSREVRIQSDDRGLRLTLYQYQSCPFCCKLRAYLDLYGFSYDVIEVNSVWKSQLKWSEYQKVPVLVCDGQENDKNLQINDSSVIMSVLHSFLDGQNEPIERLVSYYTPIISKGKRGKKIYDFPNKYFVMYGDKSDIDIGTNGSQRKEERKWRKWTDDHLVHMLSPNVYRTPSESLQTFRYFSEVGGWKSTFSAVERCVVVYMGATVMYFIGKMIKKKYLLKDNVRQSLYDACNKWIKAVGKERQFMGGDKPNLADLSVYGVLHSIEGCQAFQDALEHTNIGVWYSRTKYAVDNHIGSNS